MYSQHEHIFYVRFMVCCPLKTISNYMHYSLNGEIETVLYQMINLSWSLFSLASLPNTFCLYPKCWSLIGQLHIQIRENHWPVASHWQTLSHNVVSSTPHLNGIRTNNVNNDSTDYICRSKSNCQLICLEVYLAWLHFQTLSAYIPNVDHWLINYIYKYT
jgi:hypothetical protein